MNIRIRKAIAVALGSKESLSICEEAKQEKGIDNK